MSTIATRPKLNARIMAANGVALVNPKKLLICTSGSSPYTLRSKATLSVHESVSTVPKAKKVVPRCRYGVKITSSPRWPTVTSSAHTSRSSVCRCGIRKTKPVRSSLRVSSSTCGHEAAHGGAR